MILDRVLVIFMGCLGLCSNPPKQKQIQIQIQKQIEKEESLSSSSSSSSSSSCDDVENAGAPRVRLSDGRCLAYIEKGVPKEISKYKLIIVHGFGSSKEMNFLVSQDLMDELGLYVLLYDRAGYEESDPNPKRSIETEASDIEELANQLNLGPKFYLLGVSLGCYPAWSCINRMPERLAGVALVVPTVNYNWPSLPEDLVKDDYRKNMTKLAVFVAKYIPGLVHWWMTQEIFPSSTVLDKNPTFYSSKDLEVLKNTPGYQLLSQVHETRSHEGEKMMTRKQKADGKNAEKEQVTKKAKSENENGQSAVAAEFDEFCKVVKEQLSIQQIRDVLQINGLDSSGSDVDVLPKCQDFMFYGVLDKCPMCTNEIEWTGKVYSCKGEYSEWSKCTYSTKDPPRKPDQIKLPESLQKFSVSDLIKKRQQETKQRPKRELGPTDKPFTGMMVSLSGRLSQTHQYWKNKIEKHGGKVSNSVIGVTCLVTAQTERERGGSSKLTEAMERQIPVVSEQWIIDSIEKQEAQPLDAYDIASDLIVEGKGIPWDKQDPSNEALESFMAEVKVYGKRGVHKDSKLQDLGGYILEKNGLLYNCGFFICDLGRSLNEFCVTQLIMVPDTGLHLYYKKGRPGADPRAEEKLEQRENVDEAIKEFAKLFEEITGNDFEPWEREKKFQKKPNKFYVIDMDDGVDVRQGGLGLRQLGAAALHSKLDPHVAYFMKILCSQEIYRYALMEMAHDLPDLPVGMLSDIHLKRCEEMLLEFIEKVKTLKETGQKATAVWKDFTMKWFTLMPSTRPLAFRDYQGLADHGAAALETVRDITVASHLIGDIGDSTLEDPLSGIYNKLGCSISALDKQSDDYKMIVKYMEITYEPLKIGEVSYGASVESIYSVEPDACPSYEEIKKLPNKQLLWCGTRSSNLLRHLHKGFLPSICWLPVPGYMFGRAIVCSDAAAEAARYGFTAVDRPEGFLVLAVASLGEEINEYNKAPEPEEVKSLEEKKVGVKGLGKKKTDESEHFFWKDDIKVPCGRLVPSEHKDSPLEYNEYAAYDPKQVRIMFLVGVKFEEQDVVYEDVDPDEAGEMQIGDQ